jgi:hypothetical protein
MLACMSLVNIRDAPEYLEAAMRSRKSRGPAINPAVGASLLAESPNVLDSVAKVPILASEREKYRTHL